MGGTIPCVYEDQWLLVVDKPAGLLTIPAPGSKTKTLTNILNNNSKELNISYRLHPCHRLDKGTSGLIIYAKGKSVQEKMMQRFKDRKIKKTYIAFTQGNLAKLQGVIKNSIQGRSAITEYRVIKKQNDFDIVEVKPLTGRKNQIRIHFKQLKHPIVGEDKFAYRKDFKLKCKRLCLHAKNLEFKHPITKKLVIVSSELPQQLKNFLNRHN